MWLADDALLGALYARCEALLPQTAVGTLEAPNVQENGRTIDRLHKYYQAKVIPIGIAGYRLGHIPEVIKADQPV